MIKTSYNNVRLAILVELLGIMDENDKLKLKKYIISRDRGTMKNITRHTPKVLYVS